MRMSVLRPQLLGFSVPVVGPDRISQLPDVRDDRNVT
ncbi:MAG: hypothetical protein ACI8TQ_001109 [Planctomycetota bacterium]|jgi:hypothetical protein